MKITSIKGGLMPANPLKKINNQPSFKSNVIAKNQNQSMTQEQKTWVGVGLGFEFKLL